MKWIMAEPDAAAVDSLARLAAVHPLIARLLVIRGITDPADARTFLDCDLTTLSDPYVFSQMEKAVVRVRSAIAAREKIVVFGDYDVDGVTGSSLLYLVLTGMGATVESYIPDRITEGYGLNCGALEAKKSEGAGLVISVDCGITAFKEAARARELGLDLIITDHHETKQSDGTAPGTGAINKTDAASEFPDAFALLHPALLANGTSASLRESISGLTGVGVAFKLSQALLDAKPSDGRLRPYLDLVTLGTVADVGKIRGENRVLVRHGLQELSSNNNGQRPGIAALKKAAGLTGKKIGVGTVGFTLAPRINASGRIGRADDAFRLLTTGSPDEANVLAEKLNRDNLSRQEVEKKIALSARTLCQKMDMAVTGAIVLSSEEWHQGVIGIVASRLVEEFYRPTALISVTDGIGKGSARSIPGFDLYEGIAACSDLLLGFGGHKYAAGFTIAADNIPAFRERLGKIVLERIGPEGFVKKIEIHGTAALADLNLGLLQELEKLGPFGQGNPEPRLGARGLEVVSASTVADKHLKMRLRHPGGGSLDSIAFNRADLLGDPVRVGERLAIVFTPRINEWNGRTSVQLDIRDLKTDR